MTSSVKYMAYALETSLSSSNKWVLACLCQHMNADHLAWPSVARIARRASLSKRTVQRALLELRKNRWIRIERPATHHSSAMYEINTKALEHSHQVECASCVVELEEGADPGFADIEGAPSEAHGTVEAPDDELDAAPGDVTSQGVSPCHPNLPGNLPGNLPDVSTPPSEESQGTLDLAASGYPVSAAQEKSNLQRIGAKTSGEIARLGDTPFAMLISIYHEACPSLPRLTVLNPSRAKRLRARFKDLDQNLQLWQEYCCRVEASDFLAGRKSSTNWRATFDFITGPDNYAKIADGNYDNNPCGAGPSGGGAAARQGKTLDEYTEAYREEMKDVV